MSNPFTHAAATAPKRTGIFSQMQVHPNNPFAPGRLAAVTGATGNVVSKPAKKVRFAPRPASSTGPSERVVPTYDLSKFTEGKDLFTYPFNHSELSVAVFRASTDPSASNPFSYRAWWFALVDGTTATNPTNVGSSKPRVSYIYNKRMILVETTVGFTHFCSSITGTVSSKFGWWSLSPSGAYIVRCTPDHTPMGECSPPGFDVAPGALTFYRVMETDGLDPAFVEIPLHRSIRYQHDPNRLLKWNDADEFCLYHSSARVADRNATFPTFNVTNRDYWLKHQSRMGKMWYTHLPVPKTKDGDEVRSAKRGRLGHT